MLEKKNNLRESGERNVESTPAWNFSLTPGGEGWGTGASRELFWRSTCVRIPVQFIYIPLRRNMSISYKETPPVQNI